MWARARELVAGVLHPLLTLALVVAAAAAVSQYVRVLRVQAELAREQGARRVAQVGRERERERAQGAEAAASATQRARDEEQRRAGALRETIDRAHQDLAAARADANAARAAGERLRQRAAAVAAACRRSAAGDPAPADGGPPAADAGLVLADVLGRMEARGRELAELAGQRGAACERLYDAVSAGPSGGRAAAP